MPVLSGSAALHGLVATMLAAAPREAIRCLREPTRGGLAATVNEIAGQSMQDCRCGRLPSWLPSPSPPPATCSVSIH